MTIRIKGFRKLSKQLKAIGKNFNRELAKGLYQEAEEIMAESKEKYVPVDIDNLRPTGFVKKPVTKGRTTSVELGFGGPAAKYALIVHEDMQAKHPVGSAKYLEIPYNKAKAGLGERLADRLNKVAKG